MNPPMLLGALCSSVTVGVTLGSDDVATPHFGQTTALSGISAPQFLQNIKLNFVNILVFTVSFFALFCRH